MPVTSPLPCARCRTALPEAVFNTPAPVECPQCTAWLSVRVFPAFYREPLVGQAAEAVTSAEDAGCFYHPNKKAVVPCGECGRFLCALCDLEIGSRHVCPACASGGGAATATGTPHVAVGADPGAAFGNRVVLYERVAMMLALGPVVTIIFWMFTIVCAPAALYVVIRYWNEPKRGPLPRSRAWLVTAGIIALLEIAAWIVLGVVAHSNFSFVRS